MVVDFVEVLEAASVLLLPRPQNPAHIQQNQDHAWMPDSSRLTLEASWDTQRSEQRRYAGQLEVVVCLSLYVGETSCMSTRPGQQQEVPLRPHLLRFLLLRQY